jgi:hypothetical protein
LRLGFRLRRRLWMSSDRTGKQQGENESLQERLSGRGFASEGYRKRTTGSASRRR